MGKKKTTQKNPDDLVITPTSDVFNAVLWSAPKNERILRGFLNCVLRDGGEPMIQQATVLNPFNIKEFAVNKSLVLDVRVRDELNQQYNVEMQTLSHTAFRHRALVYWADNYSSLLRIGDEYVKLIAVRSVIITCFPIFRELEKLHAIFEARARENPEILLSDHLQIHILRLGDMIKRNLAGLGDLDPELQDWMTFFAFGDKLSEDKMSQLNELVQDAHEQFQNFTADAEMREIVRERQRFIEDQKIYLDISREEGRKEERAGIVRNMKRKGFDLRTIAEITGLSYKEIEQQES